jgi:hypothetical protein
MANGVNDSFGLTFFGEMKDLLASNGIFEQHRASSANCQRDGRVDWDTKLSSLRLAIRIASEAC